MFAGVAAFMFWGMGFKRTPMLMIFWLVPGLGIVSNFVYLKRQMAKLKAMPSPSQSAIVHSNFNLLAENAPSRSQTFPSSTRDEALLRMPAPRQIRISKGGRITIWVAALGLMAFVVPFVAGVYKQWTLYHSFSNVRGLGWGIALECVVAFAAYGIWRGQVREGDLLEHGEVVMGRVLRQWTDNKRNSTIEYEFTDFLGSSHRRSTLDRTNQLFSGMPLVVFYDRDNPKRQIAYCSTLHEVILPATVATAPQELLAKR